MSADDYRAMHIANAPSLRVCPRCGTAPALGMISASFIFIGCVRPGCVASTDAVSRLYQSDQEALDEAARLWNDGPLRLGAQEQDGLGGIG